MNDQELNENESIKVLSWQHVFMRKLIIALSLVAIVAALIPWYADHLKEKSLKQAELGHQVEALHAAERSVTVNPLSVDNLFVLAGVQQRLGRQEQAKETLIKATQLQPLNYMVWEQLAIYERDKWGQPEPAKEHFEKAVSLNPKEKELRKRAGLPPPEG